MPQGAAARAFPHKRDSSHLQEGVRGFLDPPTTLNVVRDEWVRRCHGSAAGPTVQFVIATQARPSTSYVCIDVAAG